MVNRNAARHLLFAVSILLLFFVYIGYRLAGSGPAETEYVPAVNDAAPPLSADADACVRPPSGIPSTLTPPAASQPGELLSLDDEDDVDDLEDWVPSGGGGELAMVSPPSETRPSSGGLRPVDGDSATTHSGSITGLVPSRPAESSSGGLRPEESAPQTSSSADSASVPLSLPPPGAVNTSDVRTSEESVESVPAYLPPPPSSSSSSSGSGATSLRPGSGGEAAFSTPGSGGNTPPGMPPLGGTPTSARSERRGSEVGGRVETAGSTSPPGGGTALTPSRSTEPTVSATPQRPESSSAVDSNSMRIYVIRPGDTLSNIAARELGTASLADNIFLSNRDVILDPDHLMVGMKIKLPAQESVSGYGEVSSGSDSSSSPRRPTQGLGRVHRVARGDTMSSIALQYYGSSSAWRFLYEANKSVVPDPNRLSVGTELTIPPYEE